MHRGWYVRLWRGPRGLNLNHDSLSSLASFVSILTTENVYWEVNIYILLSYLYKMLQRAVKVNLQTRKVEIYFLPQDLFQELLSLKLFLVGKSYMTELLRFTIT